MRVRLFTMLGCTIDKVYSEEPFWDDVYFQSRHVIGIIDIQFEVKDSLLWLLPSM